MRRSAVTLVALLVTCLARVETSRANSTVGQVSIELPLHEVWHYRERAREAIAHAYGSYMRHAYPADELKPVSCSPRTWNRKSRGTLDDVLGGYMLTQVDSLSALAAVGDFAEFHAASQRVASNLSFDRSVVVSVFEASIRVLGGLLSAHLLAAHPSEGPVLYPGYSGQLLGLAVDLGRRLLPAFDTPTGIPHHTVHLQKGITKRLKSETITCTAAAGTFLVEFALLSSASGDGRFLAAAERANDALWSRRDLHTGLIGGNIDINTGAWLTAHTGVGAGVDSFYEYLLKGWVLTGNSTLLKRWRAAELAISGHLQHSMDIVHQRPHSAIAALPPSGWHPRDADDACVHIEASRAKGREAPYKATISALQAFWPGLAVLDGDVASARAGFRGLFSVWSQYTALPEIWDVHSQQPVSFGKDSPLRPELLESAFHLFSATGEPLYLHAVARMLQAVWSRNAVQCGFAASADVQTERLDDRMDSYFISETLQYAFLTFESALVTGMGLRGGVGGGTAAAGEWLAARLTDLHLSSVQSANYSALQGTPSSILQAYGTWVSLYGARPQVLAAVSSVLLSTQFSITAGALLEVGADAAESNGKASALVWQQHLAASAPAPVSGSGVVNASRLAAGLREIAAGCTAQHAPPVNTTAAADDELWRRMVCLLRLPAELWDGMPVQLAMALTVRAGGSMATGNQHSVDAAEQGNIIVRTGNAVDQLHTLALQGTAVANSTSAVLLSLAPFSAAASLPAQHTLFTTEGHIVPLHPHPLHVYAAGGLASLSAVRASYPWVQRATQAARRRTEPIAVAAGPHQNRSKHNATKHTEVNASGQPDSMLSSWVHFLSAAVSPLLSRGGGAGQGLHTGHHGTCKVIDTVTSLRADTLPEGVLLGSAEEAHALARHRATDEHIVMHSGLDASTLASGIQLSLAASIPQKAAIAPSSASSKPAAASSSGARAASGGSGATEGPVEVSPTHVAMLLCQQGTGHLVSLSSFAQRSFTQGSIFAAGCQWRTLSWPPHPRMALEAPTALQKFKDHRLADMGVDGVFAFCSVADEQQPCLALPRSIAGGQLALSVAWQHEGRLQAATALLHGARFGPVLTPSGLSGAVFALASPLDACNAQVGVGAEARAFELRAVVGVSMGRGSAPPGARAVWKRPIVAIVVRGGCAFADKARVVQAAGAAAMLVVDAPRSSGNSGGAITGEHSLSGDGAVIYVPPFRGASYGDTNPPLTPQEYFGGESKEGVAIPSAILWADNVNRSALLQYIRGKPLQEAHPAGSTSLDPDSFQAQATQVWQAVFTADGSRTRPQRSAAAASGFASAGQMQPTIQRVPSRELAVLASFQEVFSESFGRDAHHNLVLWPWSADMDGHQVPIAAPSKAFRVTPVAFLRDASALVAAHAEQGHVAGNCTQWPLDLEHSAALRLVAGVGDMGAGAVWSRTREQMVDLILQGPHDVAAPPLVQLPLPPPAV